jgi:hypothetical protein
MVYFAFDLEPISIFAERECEHASRVTYARAAGNTIAPRVITASRVRHIFYYPSAHNYLIDSSRSNVEMLAASSFIDARNRMFERHGIHEVMVDRPEWRPGARYGR